MKRKLLLSLFVWFLVLVGSFPTDAFAQDIPSLYCISGSCETSWLYNCDPEQNPDYTWPDGCEDAPENCCRTLYPALDCPAFIPCKLKEGPTSTPVPTNTPFPSPTVTPGPTSTPTPVTATPVPPTATPVGGCTTNNFHCWYYPGTGCRVNISTQNCSLGFEHNENVCMQHDSDQSACQGQVNNCCIETNPDSCYECEGTWGCIPRDPTVYDCADTSQYYPDYDSCDQVCSGASLTRFRCENDLCIEDTTGPYNGALECSWYCGNTQTAMFCPIDGDPEGGINTALGCIPVDPSGFTPWVIGLGIIAAGGVAFLLMLYAGLQIIISSGDPGKLQAGKELLTAAISGLLLIIFAIFLLRVVGVEVFGIPGL